LNQLWLGIQNEWVTSLHLLLHPGQRPLSVSGCGCRFMQWLDLLLASSTVCPKTPCWTLVNLALFAFGTRRNAGWRKRRSTTIRMVESWFRVLKSFLNITGCLLYVLLCCCCCCNGRGQILCKIGTPVTRPSTGLHVREYYTTESTLVGWSKLCGLLWDGPR
jgi:hypothetical protein